MKIIEKWNNLTTKKKIILLVLVLLVSTVVLYFSETDRGRLARAYWLKNPLFCNLIIKNDIRSRCTAVLTADNSLCSKIEDERFYPFCLYGVSIKKADPAGCDEAKKLMIDRCLTHIPEMQKESQELQKTPDGNYQGYFYNETSYRKQCDEEGSIIRDHCLKHDAVRIDNFLLCDRISNEAKKEECLQTIRGNRSYFCSYSPAACVAVTYGCYGWGDKCFDAEAYLREDTNICRNIANKELRDECYIGITDEIGEFKSCCDMF
jgi:hypothetical protein